MTALLLSLNRFSAAELLTFRMLNKFLMNSKNSAVPYNDAYTSLDADMNLRAATVEASVAASISPTFCRSIFVGLSTLYESLCPILRMLWSIQKIV